MTDEFELRGILASLLCWHRLTQEEQQDLLSFVAAQPAQPAQPAQRKPLPYGELMALAKNSGLGPENVSGLIQARLEIYGRAIEAAHGIGENNG